ncbi:MAG: CoA transferase [Firmicutes bacterium]|nr:CoA transferase [Bacillota bacterium]
MTTEGPLAGIRVLDLSRVLAAPWATMALGELGADVIKVERAPDGDETRQWGPPFVGGESAYYLAANRNKQSIALDLREPRDQAIVRDLALGWADVVVENFRPGTLERWGLGLEWLRRENPRLVTASLRGYPAGDDRPGYDFVIQAASGLMSITGPADGEPYKVGVAVSDLLAGLFLLGGIEAALMRRERTGRGDHVEVSLWGAQVAALVNVVQSYLVTGEDPRRYGNAHPQLAPYQTFRTQDGWIAIGVGNDRQFAVLSRALDHPEWAGDPRFRTNPDRVAHRQELAALLSARLAEAPTGFWLSRLEALGVPAGPVATIPEALREAERRGHGLVGEVSHPSLGSLRQVRLPWHFREAAVAMRTAPPRLDQDRADVLALVARIRRAQDLKGFKKEGRGESGPDDH